MVRGSVSGETYAFQKREASIEIERYREYYREMMNGFHLSLNDGVAEELNKFNTLAWWYTHNALVHYSTPHGLEQFGGAAWGARDVCQGPVEYFMATQKYASVKEIIKKVYSHQYEEEGNWPQWFMFDQYYKIQADECHGDIIVWPLKVLGDYLTSTKDFSLLLEKVPYMNRERKEFTAYTESIWEHAKKGIKYIKQHFLHNTHLSAYDGGDWDDTLQPANAQLKQYMVSSWTVALTYQTIRQLSNVIAEIDEHEASALSMLADGIQHDFTCYMLRHEVIPGFVYMENTNEVDFMLHPEDEKTGIQYRLLPMTRSIISELFTPEQAASHYELIRHHLYYPDGVRLMNRPANYAGGVSIHFQRAEQAANFGREIGLQYVHAHIRFVESMAKLGEADEAWKGLAVINPINIQQVVPNAERRQSNAYFSSSDGHFKTRYEAQREFDKLRNASVRVKGGWRIYSSGPGIYMNQLISNCLGIRQIAEGMVIDPVLPARFDGLHFRFKFNGKWVTFIYHLNCSEAQVLINGEVVKVDNVGNRYRKGGYYIDKNELQRTMTKEDNMIDIYLT